MATITRYRSGTNWKRKSRPDVPVDLSATTPPTAPTALSSSAISDTTVTLTWVKSVSTGVTAQRIYLNSTLHTTIANGTDQSVVISGLTPNTPYAWKMTAYNATLALNSAFSNTYNMTTTGTTASQAPNAPGSPTAVKNPSSPTDQINVTWTAPTVDGSHAVQTGYRVFANGIQQGTDRPANATSYTITGLNPSGSYTITIKAFNGNGESTSANAGSVTLDAESTVVTMLMGCSDSSDDHGGTEDWDGWRTYSQSSRDSLANRTGSTRPLFLAYSEDGGQNLGGSNPNYTTVFNHVVADLNDFYYNGTGQTHSARWGIKLYWSNGNENSDKGALAGTHTTTTINNYITSQKALYDACHSIDGVTGQRRFPDAFAGSNPTQNHEQSGIVADWLHPSAKYHDFVMWSMYPPGRKTTTSDPTYNWPSFSESSRTNLQDGFLIRCFYRTFQAQLAARNELGDPNFALQIGCGEVGIGDSPANQNTRPYYTTHALAGGMYVLSQQYGLAMPFACWWDHQSDASAPQNVLTDEPVGTNPHTVTAWQNWINLDHRRGGTHPSSWTGLPAGIAKFTGTKV